MNVFELGLLQNLHNAIGSPTLDTIMSCITLFCEGGVFWIALAAIFLLTKRYRRTGLSMGIALLIGVIVINVIVKNVVARVRPYDMDAATYYLASWIPRPTDYSFPSGHALACFEVLAVLFLRERKPFGWITLVIAFLVSFSRMYLCVHFPTDVLAGAAFGTVIGIFGVFLGDKLYAYLAKRIKGF